MIISSFCYSLEQSQTLTRNSIQAKNPTRVSFFPFPSIPTRRAMYTNTSEDCESPLRLIRIPWVCTTEGMPVDRFVCDNMRRLLAHRGGVMVGVEAVEVDNVDVDSERYDLWLWSPGRSPILARNCMCPHHNPM